MPERLDEVAAYALCGVEHVVTAGEVCPAAAAYADLLLLRMRGAEAAGVVIPPEAKEHLRRCFLYFELLQALGHLPKKPPPLKEGALDTAWDGKSGAGLRRATLGNGEEPPLWCVLDDMVVAAAPPKHTGTGTRHQYAPPEGGENGAPSAQAISAFTNRALEEDACLREFWEEYRAGSAKTTGPAVARARATGGWRLATQGACKTMVSRIAEEGKFFAMKGPKSGNATSVDVQSWGFASTSGFDTSPPPPSAPPAAAPAPQPLGSTTRSIAGPPPSSTARANTRGSSRGSLNSGGRARSRGQSRQVPARKNSRSGLGTPRLPPVVPPLPLQKVAANEPEPFAPPSRGVSSRPMMRFTSWDDYRSRKKVLDVVCGSGRLGKDSLEVLQMASTRPQRELSACVVEHRQAAEWRLRGATDACALALLPMEAIGSRRQSPQAGASRRQSPQVGATRRQSPLSGANRLQSPPPPPAAAPPEEPGALTERSRRLHLPEVVQKQGALTSRPALSVPPAEFRRPWSRETSRLKRRKRRLEEGLPPPEGITTRREEERSAVERFATVCRNTGAHPQPRSIRFLVELPPQLDIRGAGFADEDVLALATSLPQDARLRLETVDAGENPRLSDAAACGLLRALSARHGDTLAELRLDHCRRCGKDTVLLCTKLLQVRPGVARTLRELQLLDLSGIPIPLQEYVDLARSVQQHPRLLDVRLAETGLGYFDKAHASRVLEILVGGGRLEALELAWNVFDVAAFGVLGRCLSENRRLKNLGLASTAPTFVPAIGGSPVLVLLEQLASNASLESIDVSQNNLDHSAALVLECAVRRHPCMRHIMISSNPLGLDGMRSLLRLLAQTTCPQLSHVTCTDCERGSTEGGFEGPFDSDPSRSYCLDLSQPAQRALLRLLLSRCADGPHGTAPTKLLRNAMLADAPLNFALLRPPRGEGGFWEVPSAGELKFDLVAGDAVMGVEPPGNVTANARVEDMLQRARARFPNQSRALTVLGQIKGIRDSTEWLLFLRALSADFLLGPEEVQGLCMTALRSPPNCGKDPGGTCAVLLPSLLGGADLRRALRCMRTLPDLLQAHRLGAQLMSLSLENPSDRYMLNLADAPDRCAAERLLLLNRWEARIWEASGRVDISEYADSKNLRNVTLDKRLFRWGAEDWFLPNEGILVFDYVSLRRPPDGATAVSDNVWGHLIKAVRQAYLGARHPGSNGSGGTAVDAHHRPPTPTVGPGVAAARAARAGSMGDEDLIWAIRAASARCFVTCRQIRELMCVFTRQTARCEVAVALFARCVNWAFNNNTCRAVLTSDMRTELRDRIGYLGIFPYFQPENYAASLDLSMNDQRRVLNILLNLDLQERPGNLRKPRISLLEGWDYFSSGVPLSWQTFEASPTRGVFEGTYFCSQDDAKWKVRRKFAMTMGGWNGIPEEPSDLLKFLKVCTVPDEVPPEVVQFADFLAVTFKSLKAAFERIDTSGDGALSLPEFMGGARDAGFRIAPEPISELRKTIKQSPDSPPSTGLSRRTVSDVNADPRLSGLTSPSRSFALAAEDGPSDRERRKARADRGIREARLQAVLTSVYRWLDPNGDGVSLAEFMALEGLWSGIQQTMWEFVEHVRWHCGSIEDAWALADEELKGTIDCAQFRAFAHKLEFDRSVDQVYMLLDDDDSDCISNEEWRKMATIQKPEG